MQICGEICNFAEDATFTCQLAKGHSGFHSESKVVPGRIWWSFRWGYANDVVSEEEQAGEF
jgi:hypothetical protein